MKLVGKTMNNLPYLLALHSIDGLGPIRLKAILKYFKDPKIALTVLIEGGGKVQM